MELEWINLIDNECPKCGRGLSAFGGFRKCKGQIGEFQNKPVCNFIIRESRFNEIFKNLEYTIENDPGEKAWGIGMYRS